MIHERPSITNVQKLQYLQRQLNGEAVEVLKNTAIIEGNCAGAWASLNNRYGNNRVLSSSHMISLIKITSAKPQSSEDLKRLIDHFNQTIRSFNSLKKPVG